MRTKIQYRWIVVCTVLSLTACQKDISDEELQPVSPVATTSAVVPDDPERVANITLVKSADFASVETFISNDGRFDNGGNKPGSKKDSDGDGIANTSDVCPQEKETVNGYQDSDGCPDTPPITDPVLDPTPVADSDGDGVTDASDNCPLEKENLNGFQDDDGCPDEPVITLPPTTIPTSYQLVTPPVGSQGNEGTCVPFAIAYGARSIEQYYGTNASAYSTGTNVFSPEYAYNLTKFADCGSGTSMTAVLDLLKNQGVCTWQTMPYDDLNGCSVLPDNSQNLNAAGYKISSYVKIVNSDQVAIKTMLASKHPVIATLIVDNSFVNARTGFVWSTYSGSGALPHTLILCGYDDAKGAYKVMNSWGTGWGDAGYSWITYDFFPQKSSSYLYAIQ
jgi:hypothetical protein